MLVGLVCFAQGFGVSFCLQVRCFHRSGAETLQAAMAGADAASFEGPWVASQWWFGLVAWI